MRPGGTEPDRPLRTPAIGRRVTHATTRASSLERRFVVASIDVQYNGDLVGTERAIDFVDDDSVTWDIIDDPTNNRVTISAAATGGNATKYAQYAAPPTSHYTIGGGSAQTVPTSDWTALDDPDGIFDPSTNKVTADGIYTFVLQVQRTVAAVGTNPVVGALLWPQTGAPMQATAPGQAATLAGAAIVSWVGYQAASDDVVVELYNRDSVSATFVATLMLLKHP